MALFWHELPGELQVTNISVLVIAGLLPLASFSV